MTAARTHHDVLGVSPAATRDELDAAARALRAVHAADADALARVAEARAVLVDATHRAAYDRELDTVAYGYLDVADPLALDRFAKLEAVGRWLGRAPAEPLRLDDWARHDAAVDEEPR